MKLFLLERKLLELRQHMEDSPGDVTCEAEELISALEEEVRSMRMDLNAASASGVGSGAGSDFRTSGLAP